MSLGTTIQIFLPDGNPRSIKLAEITSRTLQATLIPRAKLIEAGSRDELQRCSVYFLIGSAGEESKPLLYVGEAEDAYNRLKQHNKSKDFWTSAIAVVSKTQHLTKTHIKYLEWYCYQEAANTGRYVLDFIGNKDFGHKFSGIFLWSTRRLCKLQAMTMTRSEKPSFVLRKTSLTHRERLMPAIACSILTRTLDILRLFVFSFSVNFFLRGFFSAESSYTLSVHTLENPYPSAASCLPDT